MNLRGIFKIELPRVWWMLGYLSEVDEEVKDSDTLRQVDPSVVMTFTHIHIENKAKVGFYREDDCLGFVHVEFEVLQFFQLEQFKVNWMFVSGGQIRGSSRRQNL